MAGLKIDGLGTISTRTLLGAGLLLAILITLTTGGFLSVANIQSQDTAILADGQYGFNCDGATGTMNVYGKQIETTCVGVEAGGKRCLDRPTETRTTRNVRQVGEVTEGGLTCPIYEYDSYRKDFGQCRGDGIKYCMCDNPDITSNVDNGDDYWADRWGCKNIAESDFNAIGIGGDGWEQRYVFTGTKQHGGVVGACMTSIGETSGPAEDRVKADGFTVETDNRDEQVVVDCSQNQVVDRFDRDEVVASIMQVNVDVPKTEITGAVRDLVVDKPNNELLYTVEVYNTWNPVSVKSAEVTFLGETHTVLENQVLQRGTNRFRVSQSLTDSALRNLYVDGGQEYGISMRFTGAAIPADEISGTPDFSGDLNDGEIGVPATGWALGDFRVTDSTIGSDVVICDRFGSGGECVDEVSGLERQLGGASIQAQRFVLSLWNGVGEWLNRAVFEVFGA